VRALVIVVGLIALASCRQLLGLDDPAALSGDATTDAIPDAIVLPPGDWARIATNYSESCGIRTDGSLWCWGAIDRWTTETAPTQSAVPMKIGTASWLVVALGQEHSCGIQLDHSLWCWGDNRLGDVGNGQMSGGTAAVRIGTSSWLAVTVGRSHTCGVRGDATLWCWGENLEGQLGLGTSDVFYELAPTQVGTDLWTAEITAGDYTTCAVRADHTLWCWGENDFGQLGVDSSTRTLYAPQQIAGTWSKAAISYHACGITLAGALQCWGSGYSGELGDGTMTSRFTPANVGTRSDWSDVTVTYGSTCARHQDGTVECWGGKGPLGDPQFGNVATPAPFVGGSGSWAAISLGGDHVCALATDANVWCAGHNGNGQIGIGIGIHPTPTQIAGTWSSITAGTGSTCALDDQGMASCWGTLAGDGTYGIHEKPSALGGTAWTSLSAGRSFTCGLKAGGELWCWGNNSYGELGDGSTSQQLSPKHVATSQMWSTVVAAVESRACGISGTSLYCWGYNRYGALGTGDENNRTVPTRVFPTTAWAAVSSGADSTCGLNTAGQISCWGDNFGRQLGVATPSSSFTPIAVAGTYTSVSTGAYYTCGLATTGALTCWGIPALTGPGLPPTTIPGTWRSVAQGYASRCGIKTDGSLWCWGENSTGQLGNGTYDEQNSPVKIGTDTDWRAVAVGQSHTCATKQDRSVWCWGSNYAGEIGDGTALVRSLQPVLGH
jgi:alpha-tubulin suppressor-like RCC1 family protein